MLPILPAAMNSPAKFFRSPPWGVEGLAIKAFISVHTNNGGGYSDWVMPTIPVETGLLEHEAEAALLGDARRFLPCKIGRAA